MWITGTGADVLHCQHVHPQVWWITYEPNLPPQFGYTGFPADGQVVLSKGKVIVVCRKCSGAVEIMKDELTQVN